MAFDLQLVKTEVLLAELLGRFEHAVFVGMKTKTATGETYEIWEKTGNSRTCQGLCAGASAWIESRYCEMEEPADSEDW